MPKGEGNLVWQASTQSSSKGGGWGEVRKQEDGGVVRERGWEAGEKG